MFGHKVKAQGQFSYQLYRKGEFIQAGHFKNGITVEGINHLLDIGFDSGTQKTSWYVSISDDMTTDNISEDDTNDVHTWTENTDYDETLRREIQFNAASAKIISTGTTYAELTINDTMTISGLFVSSESTKGGTSGSEILWSAGVITNGLAVEDDDVLKISYSLTVQNS